jgi:hypothetical protein
MSKSTVSGGSNQAYATRPSSSDQNLIFVAGSKPGVNIIQTTSPAFI